MKILQAIRKVLNIILKISIIVLFSAMVIICVYQIGKRDHIRMSFLADKISGKPRLVLEVVIECLILAFAAIVMVRGGGSIVSLTMHETTASIGIPMGYVYSVLPISGIFIIIYNTINIIEMLYCGTADIHEMLVEKQNVETEESIS